MAAVAPTTQMAITHKCIDRWRRCTDWWCTVNCGHKPSYCPKSYCRGAAKPSPPPAPVPPAVEPVPAPGKCPGTSVMGTVYPSNGKIFNVCCPASCGECGGPKCGDRDGGRFECCARYIYPDQSMIDNQKDLARPTYVAKGLAKDDISSLKCTTATPQSGPKASAPCVLGEAEPEAADTQ